MRRHLVGAMALVLVMAGPAAAKQPCKRSTCITPPRPSSVAMADATLLIENQYADVTGDAVPAVNPMLGSPMAKHDIVLKGVPSWWSWAAGSNMLVNRDWLDAGYTHTNLWWHVYINAGNASPMDVRVELRNPRILQQRSDGTWQVFIPGNGAQGAYYRGDVTGSVAFTSRREASGSYSIPLGPLGTPGKDTAHGWYGDWPRLPMVNPTQPQAIVYTVEMRLIGHDGTPVRTAGTKFAGVVGGDMFKDATAIPTEYPAVGIARYRVLTGDWQLLSATNMSADRILTNRIPTSLLG